MNRTIIASVALASALVFGCNNETKQVPVEIPANTTAIADSLAKLKADSIVQASHDSIMKVDSQMQANNAKDPKKPIAKKPAPKADVPIATPTNPDGSASTRTIRKSR